MQSLRAQIVASIALKIYSAYFGNRLIGLHGYIGYNSFSYSLAELTPHLPLVVIGIQLTVALTWTISSMSIPGMDLCSCSKAWTERRQLGIIYQSLPLS